MAVGDTTKQWKDSGPRCVQLKFVSHGSCYSGYLLSTISNPPFAEQFLDSGPWVFEITGNLLFSYFYATPSAATQFLDILKHPCKKL